MTSPPKPAPAAGEKGGSLGRFFRWTPDSEASVLWDVETDTGWDGIRQFYAPRSVSANGMPIAPDRVLNRVIEVARTHGVRTVVCERRYVDVDFRSEHARFYGGTFRRYPSVCHRLHFFA